MNDFVNDLVFLFIKLIFCVMSVSMEINKDLKCSINKSIHLPASNPLRPTERKKQFSICMYLFRRNPKFFVQSKRRKHEKSFKLSKTRRETRNNESIELKNRVNFNGIQYKSPEYLRSEHRLWFPVNQGVWWASVASRGQSRSTGETLFSSRNQHYTL